MESFSDEQHLCFEKYLNNENVFITGPAGTGKSYLIKTIVSDAEKKEKKIKVCAMTGCAAILLQCKATTLHMFSGIGLANKDNASIIEELFTKKRHKLKNWRKLDILIIDEVSMMSLKILLLLDAIAKKIYKNDKPFGGLQVIFTGDFYQLSPVFNNEKEKEAAMYCFQHLIWNQIFPKENQIILQTIFRQNDKMILKILKYVRKGQITTNTIKALESRIFNKDKLNEIKKDKILTILSPIKREVDLINLNEYSNLVSEVEKTYNVKYIDLNALENIKDINYDFNKANELFQLYINSNQFIKQEYEFLANNILADNELKLKLGTHVMCIVNLNLHGELQIANGSQGIIVNFNNENLPYVKFNNIENPILITPYTWKSEHNKRVGVSQLPLIYAWAITIHKSQGITLENAIIDIGSNIFADGQTYVALSRVKSLEGLYLIKFDYRKIKCNPLVKRFYGDT
jgi:ATP-dependent DNA helicase PIF1